MLRMPSGASPCGTAALHLIDGVLGEAEVHDLVSLVQINYPGLLENGSVSWSSLRDSKTVTGGMTRQNVAAIIDRYNEAAAGRFKFPDNVDDMPSFWGAMSSPGALYSETYPIPEAVRERIPVSAAPGDDTRVTFLHEPGENRGKQMVYGMWHFVKEFVVKDSSRYIFSPWIGGGKGSPLEENEPNTAYNVNLNLATTTLVMDGSTAEYPLRFLLSKGWQEKLVSSARLASG